MKNELEQNNIDKIYFDIFQDIKSNIRLSDGCYQQDIIQNDQYFRQTKKILSQKDSKEFDNFFFADSQKNQLEINCINYFLTNIVLMNRYRQIKEQNVKLKQQLRANDLNKNNIHFYNLQNTRQRKKKNEVDRLFPCFIPNCDKAYGSKNSLRQHMRNKHLEYCQKLHSENISLQQDSHHNTKLLQESVYESESEINFDIIDDNFTVN